MNPSTSRIKSVAEIASVVISGVMLTFDVITWSISAVTETTMPDPTAESSKLPAESKDKVIEVSLRHVIIGFTLFMLTGAITSGAIILLKDHLRTRRQQLLINALSDIIHTIQPRKEKTSDT